MARREGAGDALRLAEDVATFEDVECFARLSARGLAGYMDCETAWHYQHAGPRVTDADELAQAEAVLTIYGRVYGSDSEFLRRHRVEYEARMDRHRDRKVRALLGQGRSAEARREVAQLFRARWGIYALSRLPGPLVRLLIVARRLLRSRWRAPRSDLR